MRWIETKSYCVKLLREVRNWTPTRLIIGQKCRSISSLNYGMFKAEIYSLEKRVFIPFLYFSAINDDA